MEKSLVVYFSKTGEQWVYEDLKEIKIGNTEIIANYIKDALKCDIFKIETVKEYPFGYKACCDEAKREMDKKERPQLKRYLDNIENYDTIYLGYPCWWDSYPMAVASFLEHYNFSGKTIKPFCTHEGSGLGISEKNLIKTLPNAKIKKGLAIQGSTANTSGAKEKVLEWLKQ